LDIYLAQDRATWSMGSRGTSRVSGKTRPKIVRQWRTSRCDQCFTAARSANVAAIQPAMKAVTGSGDRAGVLGGAFLGEEYTQLARGLRLPALVPSLGVRRGSETPLAVQAAMNLRPGQSL
jgi:hypothetical protein